MIQPSLFDALHRPPVYRSIDPGGHVLQGDPDTTLILPHPRLAWGRARIELHPHDGLWMWSASFGLDGGGRGYRIGPKWGRFAETKDDALFYAIREIREGIERDTCDASNAIRKWLDGLQ